MLGVPLRKLLCNLYQRTRYVIKSEAPVRAGLGIVNPFGWQNVTGAGMSPSASCCVEAVSPGCSRPVAVFLDPSRDWTLQEPVEVSSLLPPAAWDSVAHRPSFPVGNGDRRLLGRLIGRGSRFRDEP